jgi:transcription elongation GreA/GreB family factor
MIQVEHLSKTFWVPRKDPGFWGSVRSLFRRQKVKKDAVTDVSFRVDEGEIVGLIGANGAGKTTRVKMMAGIIHPSAGTVRVLGHDPWAREDAFRSRIALIMGQKAQLERDLARARITDFSEATTDQVSVGTVVDLRDVTSGKAVRYSVLGAWDSDPDAHRIAYKTPLGQALMGKKVGEHVKLKIGGANQEYQIAGITRFIDAK